jgi:hypothetical protein
MRLFVGWLAPQAQPAAPGIAMDRPRTRRWDLVLLSVTVLSFLAGISAVGIAHQTAWLITSPEPLVDGGGFRAAAARMASSNNLKEIGLAEHNYGDSRHALTPGGLFDSQGRALHGWQTLLLPYLEAQQLYESINLQVPWNAPQNARHFKVPLRMFCYQYTPKEPEVDADGYGLSHYAANVRLLGRDTPLSFQQIGPADRLGSTILAGEAAGNYKPLGSSDELARSSRRHQSGAWWFRKSAGEGSVVSLRRWQRPVSEQSSQPRCSQSAEHTGPWTEDRRAERLSVISLDSPATTAAALPHPGWSRVRRAEKKGLNSTQERLLAALESRSARETCVLFLLCVFFVSFVPLW